MAFLTQDGEKRFFCYTNAHLHKDHTDALFSAVALKVNCDLQLTLMTSSSYRHLAQQVGKGYDTAEPRHVSRDVVDATVRIRSRQT